MAGNDVSFTPTPTITTSGGNSGVSTTTPPEGLASLAPRTQELSKQLSGVQNRQLDASLDRSNTYLSGQIGTASKDLADTQKALNENKQTTFSLT